MSEFSVLQDTVLWTICTLGLHWANYLYCRTLLSELVSCLYCRTLLSDLSIMEDIAHWTVWNAGHCSLNFLYCRISFSELYVLQDITQWTICTAQYFSVEYLNCRTLLSELSVLKNIIQWTICNAGHCSVNCLYCRTPLSELSVLQGITHWTLCTAVHFFSFLIRVLWPFPRIFHLYRADCLMGENWRTREKNTWPSVSRTWLSLMWPEWGLNHSSEKPIGLRVNSPIH